MLYKCPTIIDVENRNIPYSKISARSSNNMEITKPIKVTHKKTLIPFVNFPLVALYIEKNAIIIKRKAIIGLLRKPIPIARNVGTARQ